MPRRHQPAETVRLATEDKLAETTRRLVRRARLRQQGVTPIEDVRARRNGTFDSRRALEDQLLKLATERGQA